MNVHDSHVNYTDRDLLEFLAKQQAQDVRWGSDFEQQLLDTLDPAARPVGASLPWSECADLIRFRPSELSIHAGMNGHHKSMVTGQLLQWFALQGERVGIMSFEMPVADTMRRMCQQAAGSPAPSREFVQQWAVWCHDRIAFYDKLDTTPAAQVLGVVFHMAKVLGCRHILIDSLTNCGLPYGERGEEKRFAEALCATAKAFGIHVHLVVHVRKPSQAGEEHIPSKFDIRGAGEITDLAHNVVIHWADKRRAELKRKQDAGRKLSEKEAEYLEQRTDQRLIVAKQRNGAFEGPIGLNFHDSLQFYRGRLLRPEFPRIHA